ncbi:MAG: phospho-sugar mutase, partial [Lachnospiraceae bacterium]|nr:phospho-sugar mutase [Lachnospiraceae bacterium]
LEKQGKDASYIFGFEESYGYLSGSYVRDKDAVDGAFLICEMFAYYKTRGISLLDKLDELYAKYGYCLNTLHSYEFEGSAGLEKMQGIMATMRNDIPQIGGIKVVKVNDYLKGIDGLPKSDVIKFFLEGNSSVVVRPSGTEPKMKVYVSVSAENETASTAIEKEVVAFMEQLM